MPRAIKALTPAPEPAIARVPDRPWLLDLFSGAGGAGEGYRRAGFHVVAVDLDPKPLRHNPHEWYIGDALAVLDTLLAGGEWQGYHLWDFQMIHASPPCQAYSRSTVARRTREGRTYPDLLAATRERLVRTRRSWVLENVPGAPMWQGVMLCGSMFGLQVIRHRLFDSSEWLYAPCGCQHAGTFYTVIGHSTFPTSDCYERRRKTFPDRTKAVSANVARRAMGIEWMPHEWLSQAIPPAYTHWLGTQLMAVIRQGEAATA